MRASWNRWCTPCMALTLLVISLLACKKRKTESDPVASAAPTVSSAAVEAKKRHPEIQQFMERVGAIAKKAKTEPPVRKGRPFREKLDAASFLVTDAKWLDDPHADVGANELELKSTVLSLCAYAAKDDDPGEAELGYMNECLGWKYFAVVRPRRVGFPKVNTTAKSFTPGSFEGDLLLFAIGSGEIQGRYRMNITNSDELVYIEGKSEDEWQEVAKRDLLDNVTGVIRERLALERDSMGG